MKMSVSPDQPETVPSGAAALSSSRSEVVPTAIDPAAGSARGIDRAAAASAETSPRSACIRGLPVSSALTGRNVPAPTCSVTKRRVDAARVEPGEQLRR